MHSIHSSVTTVAEYIIQQMKLLVFETKFLIRVEFLEVPSFSFVHSHIQGQSLFSQLLIFICVSILTSILQEHRGAM
jgi:hypothetical protein